MLTGGDGLNGKDPPSRLTEDDVRAYIDKLLAYHESKTHPVQGYRVLPDRLDDYLIGDAQFEEGLNQIRDQLMMETA